MVEITCSLARIFNSLLLYLNFTLLIVFDICWRKVKKGKWFPSQKLVNFFIAFQLILIVIFPLLLYSFAAEADFSSNALRDCFGGASHSYPEFEHPKLTHVELILIIAFFSIVPAINTRILFLIRKRVYRSPKIHPGKKTSKNP